jgi:hypothetical protein
VIEKTDHPVTQTGNVGKRGTTTVLHVRRWVRWWFYVGIVCGAVALANIFFRHLTRGQEELILFLGVLHWLLGGLVCWAWDGIRVEKADQEAQQMPSVPAGEENRRKVALHDEAPLRKRSLKRMALWTEYLRRWEERHLTP